MSVQGLCQICESAVAKHTCVRCGALVCDAHFDAQIEYCTDCAAKTRRSVPGEGDGGVE